MANNAKTINISKQHSFRHTDKILRKAHKHNRHTVLENIKKEILGDKYEQKSS